MVQMDSNESIVILSMIDVSKISDIILMWWQQGGTWLTAPPRDHIFMCCIIVKHSNCCGVGGPEWN